MANDLNENKDPLGHIDITGDEKSKFEQAVDLKGGVIGILNVAPNSVSATTTGVPIDCTGKTILIFDEEVSILLNGTGTAFIWPRHKELGVTLIDSVTPTGTGSHIVI